MRKVLWALSALAVLCTANSVEANMAKRRYSNASLFDTLKQVASERGVPFDFMRKFAGIESSFNPNAKTGSYKGLFQLSNAEFRRGGGRGNIYDARENASAFANVIKAKSAGFQKMFGRAPSGAELYLMHQQGEQGAAFHLTNPDKLAWQNMYATGEGRKRGRMWARDAVWGNVPTKAKRQFGSVDNLTSGDFVRMWTARYHREGQGGPWGAKGDNSTEPMPPIPSKRQDRIAENASAETKDIVASFDAGNGVKFGGAPIDAETGKPYKNPGPAQFNMPEVRPIEQANSGILPQPGSPPIPSRRDEPVADLPARRPENLSPVYGAGSASTLADNSQRSWGDVFGQQSLGEIFSRSDQGGALTKVIQQGLGSFPRNAPLFRDVFGF